MNSEILEYVDFVLKIITYTLASIVLIRLLISDIKKDRKEKNKIKNESDKKDME